MDKLKTAAYCRVSTDMETQEGSYELQVAYFTDLINANPTMELVGIYGDKGKSGLKISGRPGLQKLMDDSRAGKINLILTKSISRFARNMADCAAMVRELRDLGVNIIFEEQNLNTQDEKSILVLNILAAIAEEESHSISQHALLAHEQYTLEGRPFGAIAFGYKNGGDNKWIINEEEAPRVRKAFELAAQGKCYRDIQKALDAMETGDYKWPQSRVRRMLTNVVYKGDYFARNQTVCLVPGKQVANRDYKDRIYIEEHHEAIISPEQFDWVQEIISRGILYSRRRLSKEDVAFLKGGAHSGENSNEN
jgi:DNA invertase Pin-like site-specific DNA recombinase